MKMWSIICLKEISMYFSGSVKIHSKVPLLVLAETQLKSLRVLCVFPFCFLGSTFLFVPGNCIEVLIFYKLFSYEINYSFHIF